MRIGRREFGAGAAGLASMSITTGLAAAARPHARDMYGLIGKMLATPGQRDALLAILLEGTAEMPGCLSYVIAKDPADVSAIWISEVWVDQERHQASLSLPAVKSAIARARPMIAGFGERFVTTPVGGHGLAAPKPG